MNLRRLSIEAGLSAAIALVLSMIVFGPHLDQLDVGWSGGDMLSTYVNALNWGGFSYRVSDHFGYPLGMNLNYFPGIDITQNTFAWIVNSVTGSTFLGINLLIVLSFPLVAALALVVIRMTGLQGPIAIVLAVAFTFIPYHWGRAPGHTYLATLYSGVIGLALVLLIGSGEFSRRIAPGAAHRRLFIAVITVMGVIVAWSGVYYVAFTLILGVSALLWRFATRARWRAIGFEAIPLAAIAVLAILGFVPSIATTWADPPLASLSERMSIESVTYAGALALALLPLPMSEFPRMGYYNEAVTKVLQEAPWVESFVITNSGTWATTLAVIALVVGLLLQARKPKRSPTVLTLAFVGYLTLVAILFFVPWGLNLIFAEVVTGQIRAWNRLLPILLLLFTLGGAIAIQRFGWSRRWMVTGAVAAVLLVLTAVDAVLPFRVVYRQVIGEGAEVTTAARGYATQVNQVLPTDCGILQLPYMAYPEHGPERGVNDYDHFWVSTTNPVQRFSYGSVKSTDASVWAAQLPQVPSDEQIGWLRGAGFCAIHLDTRGYIAEVLGPVQADLAERFGQPVATGYDGDWELYDIRSQDPAAVEQVNAFLSQPFIEVNYVKVTPVERDLTNAWWWMRASKAELTLRATSQDAPVTSIRGEIGAPPCGPIPATVTLQAGQERTSTTVLADPTRPGAFELSLTAPGAEATLTVEVLGRGCTIDGVNEPRFAKVMNLMPNLARSGR